jgi:hypothetical protein
MPHPIVQMLQFARSEFERGLEGLTDEEARHRPAKSDGSSMNCITFTIGHLADQEWRLFVRGVGGPVNDQLERFATGRPALEVPLADVLGLWNDAKTRADEWLLNASEEDLTRSTDDWFEDQGICVMRTTYHYFFHAGEINATRQLLGHPEIPFIGLLRPQLQFPLA